MRIKRFICEILLLTVVFSVCAVKKHSRTELVMGTILNIQFFSNKKNGLILGYLVGVCGRFLCHQISGLIFYTAYVDTLEGNIAAIWASTVYNLSYILPEAILTLVLLALPPIQKTFVQIKKIAIE